jgi:hypothetical protein
MKLNKLFLGLLGLAGFVASSCSSSDDYQWATASGEQVYFSNELPSQQNLSMYSTTLTIPVSRVNTSGSTSVNISITSDDNAFTGPSSVSFADGAATADLVLTYEPDSLGYDNPKNVTLTITDTDKTNAYGYSTYKFTAVIPAPFKTLGKGTLVENYMWGYENAVTIAQNQDNKNVYRIYGATAKVDDGTASDYLEITLLQPGDEVRGVTVTQKDLVFFSDYNTGYLNTNYDGYVKWYHPSAFANTNPESNWLHNKVLAYQEDGVTPGQIQLAPRYYMDDIGGWNASQADGIVVITFPGYAPKDFSAAIDYQGTLAATDGNTYATIFAELGADATNVLAAVVSVDADAEAVADALASGDLEGTAVQNGLNFVEIPEGLTGKLQVVIAVIDGDAVKNVQSAIFEYYGGGKNPWQSLGVGLVTDNLFITMYSPDGQTTYDPIDIPCEIQENTEEPGLYRLVDLFGYYGDEGYTPTNIEVNATDADAVYVPYQQTGIDDGEGMTYICTYGGYMTQKYEVAVLKEYGYMGTLENGIITFPKFDIDENDPSQGYYQGIFAQGSKAWYTGTDGEFKIVLPEAVPASARAKAMANAKARAFAKRMFGNKKGQGFGMKEMKIKANHLAPITKAQKIAE